MAVLNEAFAGIVEGTENSYPPCQDDEDYNLVSFEYGETNPTPFTFTLNSITRVEVSEEEFNQDSDEGQAKMAEIRVNSGEDCTKAFIFTGDSDTRNGSSNFPQVRIVNFFVNTGFKKCLWIPFTYLEYSLTF